MQMLNFDYKNKFIVDVPKLNKPKLNIKQKKNSDSNTYLAITSIIIIVILFNFET